ncbi:TVP38/TMEM64 family protein [Texcoconibacillus texcoconensis]|uniref:TVP38/TMEM64 family membrane protein n=1 Tax=Texcoconibacillus texcoconensis TaxID=1095777 RepID=A0A840QMV1_9BACI|nr:putative membrane protein YdjX (TVP38/TMEM64 family) [Texcoconibacillus texcoconensis]
MELGIEEIPHFIERAGWIAPLLFIFLHLIRPLFFVPVMVICIIGGYLFGVVYGTIYSVIGLSLMSFIFYRLVESFPAIRQKVTKLKTKLFKDRMLTLGQVMILRMMPFVHFHLLSLYLMEMTGSFRDYMKYSVGGVILPSLLYTSFGRAITDMPPLISLISFLCLMAVFYYLGQRGTVSYKWDKFFPSRQAS